MSKLTAHPMGYLGSIFVLVTLGRCRVSIPSQRIINGTEINPPHKYPFLVAYYFDGCYHNRDCRRPGLECGGSILNKHWVVTAAHCCTFDEDKANPGKFYYDHLFIITGAHNLSDPLPWSQNLSISHCVIHPLYKESVTTTNDIALVRVKGAIIFNDKVTPMNLPSLGFDVTEDGEIKAQAIGWGDIGYRNNETEVPNEVTLPLVTLDTCQRSFGYFESRFTGTLSNWSLPVVETGLCAGYGVAPKAVCFGDSGSPLVTYNPDFETYTQVGITSWGIDCSREGFYSVFANVAKHIVWMKSVIRSCQERIIKNAQG